MKKVLFILIFILSLSFFACKKDEENKIDNEEKDPPIEENGDKNNEESKDPEPLSENNNNEEPQDLELIFSETCFYDLALDADLAVEITNIVKIDSLKIDENTATNYTVEDNKLIISKEYLNNIGYKTVVAEFTNDNKTYMFNIKVMDSREPALNDVAQKSYVGDDMVFSFDLYDGKIVNVKYNNEELCIDCYRVEGNNLIISKTYISSLENKDNQLEYKISYNKYGSPNQIMYKTGTITISDINHEKFNEDNFNNEIVITDKSSTGKKTFEDNDYSEFYNIIKDYEFLIYNFNEDQYNLKYTITFENNTIKVYDNNLFVLNNDKYILTKGNFAFLKDYSYSISSGVLPWV